MHRVVTIERGTHPDTPPPGDVDAIQRRLWAVYIDGHPTFWFPDRDRAREVQKQVLETGRYEYVDLVLTEDPRTNVEDRRTERKPWKHSSPQPVRRGGRIEDRDRRSA